MPSAKQMTSSEFESNLHAVLAKNFPFAVLPNVRLFRPSYVEKRHYGFEMDNVLHIAFEGSDYVIVIEAKNQPVKEVNGKWQVNYQDGPKCARRQIGKHIATLREYVEPLARNVDLRFLGIVVSSSEETDSKDLTIGESEQYCCRHYMKLPELLEQRFNLKKKPDRGLPEVFRLSQSGFLELFRMGVPLELLGHPEIQSAIQYVERCRRSLDETVFQHFSPTPDRWAINGSAGMGKSVLLGYAACVLACGSELEYDAGGKPRLKSADGRFAGMKFNPSKGSLGVFSMTQRQLDNLRHWFDHFSTIFRSLDVGEGLRFRRPEFHLCRTMTELEEKPWSAVLLDEAHDLTENAAKRLVFRHNKDGFYLMLACDRHQRLRLAGDDARIVEGLDFSSHTKRLRQIYRNPSPVYIASLALMFRWYSKGGPKIVPTKEELEGAFGFTVAGSLDEGCSLELLNDAHPANAWSHTVASFPSASAAFQCLSQAKLGRKEVLWVRFSGENNEFDYEQLSAFTYHNFRTEEAEELTDKYIKGQDFPMVVIEGFPRFMDRYKADGGVADPSGLHERKMWKFRRELYLCASRATCFLYFICTNSGSPEADSIRHEITRLTEGMGRPTAGEGNARTWSLKIGKVPEADRRKLAVFIDSPAEAQPTTVVAQAPAGMELTLRPTPVGKPTQIRMVFDYPEASLAGPENALRRTPPSADLPVNTQPEPSSLPAEVLQRSQAGAEGETTPTPPAATETAANPRPVYVLKGPIPVKDVAEKLEVKPFKVISELITLKIFASADKAINEDLQRILAEKRGFEVRMPTEQELLEKKLTELQQHFSK